MFTKKIKILQKVLYPSFIVSIPIAVFADASSVIGKVKSDILNPIAGLFASLAAVMFLYGVFEYFQSGLNEKELENARRHVVWGILGLVIIFSVQGIINVITQTVTGL